MTHNLVDYLRTDEPHDLHHSLFPNLTAEEMQREWENLADKIVVDLQITVKSHIDTLYIPDMHEPLTASVFPVDMHLQLGRKIDEAVPHWNIAQKSIAFNVYLHELYNQARNDLFNRVRDKHNSSLKMSKKHINTFLSSSPGQNTELEN